MMRSLLVPSLAMAVLLCSGSAVAQDEAAVIEKGKAVYDSVKPACKACHNEKKNPHSEAESTAEDIKGWLRTPKEMFKKTGKEGMMPAYSEKKISDEDLEALTAYLLSLR